MGSVLIETMVQSVNDALQPKKVHPFFVKGPQETSLPHPIPSSDSDANLEDATSIEAGSTLGSLGKRRTDDASTLQDAQVTKKQRKKRNSDRVPTEGTITAHLTKPSLPESINSQIRQTIADIPTPPLSDNAGSIIEPFGQEQASTEPKEVTHEGEQLNHTPRKPPTKVLKLDPKTGTFSLPTKPEAERSISRIVTIRYGRDDAHRESLGSRISQILSEKPPTKRRARKPRTTGHAEEGDRAGSKPLQAFFTSKTKELDEISQPSSSRSKSPAPRRHTIFMSTPVSPRKARLPPSTAKPSVQWGSTKPVGTKVPGALHPAWPSRETAHVRGYGGNQQMSTLPQTYDNWIPRKYKGQATKIATEDSIVSITTQKLDLQSMYGSLQQDDSQVHPVPKELRQPTRLFESGRKLQKRMMKELHTKATLGDSHPSSEDELEGSRIEKPHPFISQLHYDLGTRLSAYDRSTCENSAWTNKYAPTTANQILQAGKEAFLLKDWLEALQVQSVDKGNTEGNKTNGKSDKAPRKKRKKKLDDFIVDSDESEEMDEISENEDDWVPAGPGLHKKSVVHRLTTKDQSRIANSMVVSGPHGCGKTAAIHAVAKELGFEVFEINSSSRRSGKDILDKVGDMTRNHLVQRRQQDEVDTSEPEVEVEDQVAQDLISGKQGMMTAFFKPKPAGVLKQPKQPNEPKKRDPVQKTLKEAKKATQKTQKQSLILLEEVDVLYDEDKQFWATIMSLMAQSRRPFIMTCNDESLIPIQSLHLHGILRFSPPPTTLAVDSCLLIAAHEGHALQRTAVEALYVSRNHDLRATIMELNYWCQIGVGDRRGGFDWLYLRWPKGRDEDEHGDVVRVISQNTYTKGMGWLGRDLLVASSDTLEKEEEALHQCWNSWRAPVGDWQTSLNMPSCMARLSEYTPPQAQYDHLAAYGDLCDSLSDSDILSQSVFAGNIFQDIIDSTVPELPPKAKGDYTVGRELLEATILTCPADLTASISLSVSSYARQDLLAHASRSRYDEACSILSPVGEKKSTAILESKFRDTPHDILLRRDVSFAFDPLATSEAGALTTSLDPSVFDRTMGIIVTDVAPWVRGIVLYDQSLMLERRKLSNLLSEGGQKKRMRNTRSAYSALEGGERKTTRRDNYFQGAINTKAILDTGMKAWRNAVRKEEMAMEKEGAQRSTTPGTDSPEDTGSDT